jgi:hypothetical protein
VASSITVFLAVYAVMIAFGSAVAGNLGSSALVTNWFVANRGRALTIAILGTSAGQMIIPKVIAGVIASDGLAAAYRLFALLILVVAAVVAFIAVDRPEKKGLEAWGAEEAAHVVTSAPTLVPVRQILGRLDFWLVGASYLLTVVVYLGLGATMIPYAISAFGVSGPEAANLALIMGLAGIVGKMFFAVVALYTTQDYNMLYLASACVGASSGGVLPVWPGLVAQRFGRPSLPQVMGLMSPVVVGLQGFGAPFIVGMHFKPAYPVLAVLLVLSAILSSTLSRPVVPK